MPIVDAGPAREPRPHTRPSQKPDVPTHPFEVEIYDDIGRAAMCLVHAEVRTDYFEQFELWTIARMVDREGSGRARVNDIMAAMKNVRGFSRASLSITAREGDGLFWRCHFDGRETWLYLVGVQPLAEALGVKKMDDPLVFKMPRKMKDFHALVAAGLLSRQDYKTCRFEWVMISRATMARQAGVEPNCISAYLGRLRKYLDVRENVVVVGEWNGGEIQDGYRLDKIDGKLQVVKILPNSYRLKIERKGKGHVRDTNKTLQQHSPQTRGSSTGEQGGRLFWPLGKKSKNLAHKMGRAKPGDVFIVQKRKGTRGRARVWEISEAWQKPDGQTALFPPNFLEINAHIGGGKGGYSHRKDGGNTGGGSAMTEGVVLYFDGGIRPINPGGVATYGWVIEQDGQEIACGKGIAADNSTNNVAEYAGLIEGLKALRERGIQGAAVCGDSQLVVNQMTDLWCVNSERLFPLWWRARDLAQGRHLRIGWIPREKNARADELATAAYDEASWICSCCSREWTGWELRDGSCAECGGSVRVKK